MSRNFFGFNVPSTSETSYSENQLRSQHQYHYQRPASISDESENGNYNENHYDYYEYEEEERRTEPPKRGGRGGRGRGGNRNYEERPVQVVSRPSGPQRRDVPLSQKARNEFDTYTSQQSQLQTNVNPESTHYQYPSGYHPGYGYSGFQVPPAPVTQSKLPQHNKQQEEQAIGIPDEALSGFPRIVKVSKPASQPIQTPTPPKVSSNNCYTTPREKLAIVQGDICKEFVTLKSPSIAPPINNVQIDITKYTLAFSLHEAIKVFIHGLDLGIPAILGSVQGENDFEAQMCDYVIGQITTYHEDIGKRIKINVYPTYFNVMRGPVFFNTNITEYTHQDFGDNADNKCISIARIETDLMPTRYELIFDANIDIGTGIDLFSGINPKIPTCKYKTVTRNNTPQFMKFIQKFYGPYFDDVIKYYTNEIINHQWDKTDGVAPRYRGENCNFDDQDWKDHKNELMNKLSYVQFLNKTV